ncbi:hypothetical protein FRC01_009647, partial [Tulasnella sp. 417]
SLAVRLTLTPRGLPLGGTRLFNPVVSLPKTNYPPSFLDLSDTSQREDHKNSTISLSTLTFLRASWKRAMDRRGLLQSSAFSATAMKYIA